MINVSAAAERPTPLTANQIRGFWAAWAGWALDGMDSFIYALVLVPALNELLPSVGRFAGTGITFLVGSGVAYFHTIGTPVALTSIAFLIGLLLLPYGEETRGQPLLA